MDWTTAVGGLAAFLTTASYVPQLRKCWQTRSAGDLSLRALIVLTAGVTAWLAYGVMRSDNVIIAANGASLVLLLGILSFKLRRARPARNTGTGAGGSPVAVRQR
jgi:MtN3 and saliva related transmembrane protein